MATITVVEGDITRVPTDALIAVVNSAGMWFGNIDGAIRRVAGGLYHNQLVRRQYDLKDGEAIYAASGNARHSGAFKDVIFVIDDLEQPVESIVLSGIESAIEHNARRVTIPTIRTGAKAGQRETLAEALDGLAQVVGSFTHSGLIDEITIVVYNNPSHAYRLRQQLRL